MKPPVRIALIGAGSIAWGAHKPVFLKHPKRIVAAGVADPFRPGAEKLSAELGNVPAFDDVGEMLDALAGSVDAVLITTPHWLHYPAAAEALKRGLPALVEKPAVCSLAEMRKLMLLEKKTGAFVMAGQMQRFERNSAWLRRWCHDQRKCGALRNFHLNIWQNIHAYLGQNPANRKPWIVDGKKAGGGICISVGIHPLDLLRFISGADFVEVNASGRYDKPFVNGAESLCVAQLRMSNGMVGTLNASYGMTKCAYSQGLMLSGEHGTVYQHIEKPGGGYAGELYFATTDGRPVTSWNEMYGGFQKVAETEFFQGAEEEGPFARQLLEFAAAVSGRRRPRENTLDANFNTIAVIEALGQAMRTNRPQKVAVK